eukprot:CAMPEP_0177693480 /NCGR_PEP_ID=MMETSP0484_2-20121128/2421_1 /TAXON_ID=354590 /ORGANISM="Rhodomonas lens, Strain RHODO" /LENGTH=116 /DNA_ID=CAMNT_0019204291 /DNA_START=121 /DNA_END=468 /DNA_ORIENTATION=-
MEAGDKQLVWVRGPHFQGNGVLLSSTRLLTSRQALFTCHDATLASILAISGDALASAPCLPARCLLTNQALGFCIVAVSPEFSRLSGAQPVAVAEEEGAQASEGDELEVVTWIGNG